MSEKKIHIAVACHKPSRLPKNSMLVPVQVNSATAARRMNMAHDDDGNNISLKNPHYCELTAQYWEWKNVEADYYGLCHYRRFLCFNVPSDAKRNNREHIEAESIDDINIARFGLENEDQMRRVIEANDVIVGEYEKISKLFTPRGNQLTTYKHWTAHDRALINVKDLEKMLDILDEVNPEIGADAREYLNKDVFTGFNCFVLRKDLFNELCETEFKVLEELEKYVDLSHYSTQLSRIYGFMGEIISSSYIYHLEKSGKYNVKHVPLLYFNYTDETADPVPVQNEKAVRILFHHNDRHPELFAVTWQSFLDNVSADHIYDTVIFNNDMTPFIKNTLTKMAAQYPNVKIQYLEGERIEKEILEHWLTGYKEVKIGKKPFQEILPCPILPFLPYYLNQYSEIAVITKNTILTADPALLWDEQIPEDKIFAAPIDVNIVARVNDIYPETESDYLYTRVRDPYNYYGISAMKVNLDRYREKYTRDQITLKCVHGSTAIPDEQEILNAEFEGCFHKISQVWNVWYETTDYLKYQLPYAPKDNYQELVKARRNPAAVTYLDDDPFELSVNETAQLFWGTAKKTPFYEYFLAYRGLILKKEEKVPFDITEKLFPKGSAARGFVSRVIPKDSAAFKKIKKALSVFNME